MTTPATPPAATPPAAPVPAAPADNKPVSPSVPPADSSTPKAPDASADATKSADGSASSTSGATRAELANAGALETAAKADTSHSTFDTLTDLKAAQGPLAPTSLDSQGVERIVGPSVDDNWRPAPVDPTEEEIAHRKRVAEHAAARRDDRLAASQVAPDNQGDGHAVGKAALEAERV